MMELAVLHHGGHLIAPHRAPPRGGFQSRPTLGEASPSMEVVADTRGGLAALLKKPPMLCIAPTPRDVRSIGSSPDLPLLDLKTD
jgi:hypothetical protein